MKAYDRNVDIGRLQERLQLKRPLQVQGVVMKKVLDLCYDTESKEGMRILNVISLKERNNGCRSY